MQQIDNILVLIMILNLLWVKHIKLNIKYQYHRKVVFVNKNIYYYY